MTDEWVRLLLPAGLLIRVALRSLPAARAPNWKGGFCYDREGHLDVRRRMGFRHPQLFCFFACFFKYIYKKELSVKCVPSNRRHLSSCRSILCCNLERLRSTLCRTSANRRAIPFRRPDGGRGIPSGQFCQQQPASSRVLSPLPTRSIHPHRVCCWCRPESADPAIEWILRSSTLPRCVRRTGCDIVIIVVVYGRTGRRRVPGNDWRAVGTVGTVDGQGFLPLADACVADAFDSGAYLLFE